MHISLRILLALLGFIACVLGVGMTVQWAASSLPVVVSYVLAGLAVSASVFGLVHALRRHVDREPMDLVRFDRTTAPLLVLGIVIALVVATAGSAISVWLGFAQWGAPPPPANLGLAAIIVTTAASVLLVQGFPEELVFRGYLFANLRERMPLWATVTLTSVIFGSIHVVSNGGATTIGERLVYALMATGFGVMLAACRTASGALWPAVGFHAGHNTFARAFITVRPDAYVGALLVTFGALVTAAAVTFALSRSARHVSRRARRGPRTGRTA